MASYAVVRDIVYDVMVWCVLVHINVGSP
jgi:hypothetical protein